MHALKQMDMANVLFLDIETVPAYKSFSELSPDWQDLWARKARFMMKNDETPDMLYEKASIYAEFGKVIVIGVGVLRGFDSSYKLRVKTYAGHDEKAVLADFAGLLNSHYHGNQFMLCAHNGKEFDFPYLARRMMVHGIPLPFLLDTAGKKPWEVPHLDTMELWKFGDFKNFTSLNLLAHLFGIPTPKDDMDGSQVGPVYWQENDLDRIATYCRKDVVTLAQLMLRFRGESLIPDEHVILAEN
ncbi:MAG: 3'-5' exonuclease [Bacteroidetes bacterium]|nr:3'-5' exonuclease [Bacteroidota bacterium]